MSESPKNSSRKVIKLLNNFNYTERKRFIGWLEWELDDKNPELVKLARVESLEIDKIKLFKKLFPKDSYSSSKLSRSFTLLHVKLRKYLALEYVGDHEDQLHLNYIKALDEKGFKDFINDEAQFALKKISDTADVEIQYLLERLEVMELHAKNAGFLGQRSPYQQPDLFKYFIVSWVTHYLFYSLANLNYNRVLNTQIPDPFDSMLGEQFWSDPVYSTPTIEILQDTVKLLNSRKVEGLGELLVKIESFELRERDRETICFFILNHLIQLKRHKQDLHTNRLSIQTHEKFIDEKWILSNGDLHVYHFENWIHSYRLLGSVDEVSQTIEKDELKEKIIVYGGMVPKEKRENYIRYGETIHAFLYKEYSFFIRNSNKSFATKKQEFTFRMLRVQMLFDMEEMEEFRREANKLKGRLKNAKDLASVHVTEWTQRLELLLQLSRVKNKQDVIAVSTAMANLPWFLDINWMKTQIVKFDKKFPSSPEQG
ncbi:MAG: hypothetical protein AAF135_12205 [Bacteroidota bacterium]